MYRLAYHPQTPKQLKKLPTNDRKRVAEKIKQLAENSLSPNLDVKKMISTNNFYRLRVGDIRVIFEINHALKTVYIQEIGFRGGIYH